MNKNLLIALLAILAIVVIGGGVYYTKFYNNNTNVNSPGMKPTTVSTPGKVVEYNKGTKLEDTTKVPVAKVESGSGGSLISKASLTFGGKEYSGESITVNGVLEEKDGAWTLTYTSKVENTPTTNSGEISSAPSYKDEKISIPVKFADEIYSGDLKSTYKITTNDLESGKSYSLEGIKVASPDGKQTVDLFYKFISDEIQEKNAKLLEDYNKARDEIIKESAPDMGEKLIKLRKEFGLDGANSN